MAAEPRAGVPTDAVEDSGSSSDQRIDGLLFGVNWSGPAITYSDPDRSSDFASDYWADMDGDGVSVQFDDFAGFRPAQLEVVHAALNSWTYTQPRAHAGFSVEGFTALDISYAGAGSGEGILRFANSGDPPPGEAGDTAYAFLPDPWGAGGDAWFDRNAGQNPVPGNYDYMAIVHEAGHTLGLKHGHETDNLGALPADVDSLEFSLMTYRTYIGANPDFYRAGDVDFPQTFMMLDIAALQHLYGADFTTNGGNTTYSWDPETGRSYVDGELAIDPAGNRVFLTVWDGGGKDAYDLSDYTVGLTIDLNPGGYSVLDPEQLADLGGGPNGGHARGSVFNALQYDDDARSLIENAFGGSGDDRIVGNAVANRLVGNRGDDTLLGRDGDDRLQGAWGDDTVRGGRGDDVLKGGWHRDVLIGGAGDDQFVFTIIAHSPRAAGPDGWDVINAGDAADAFEGRGAADGDVIDLSGLDTGVAGVEELVFGDRGRGHVWVRDSGDDTLVCADTRGNGHSDLLVCIRDGATAAADYTADDFLL